MKKTISDLINISQYAGNRADYTQGGGGNTSVKDDKIGVMLIKASGYKLKDITEKNAFVAVDKKNIFDYYNSVDLRVKKDYEKESAELSKNSVITLKDLPTLRPSVEVGFHAILKKYVIHTHSVYANILTCSKQGKKLANKLFAYKGYGFIFLPYINPGFELTLAMKKGIEDYIKKYNKYPEVIFMKNHGLVVNSDDLKRVKEVNTDVNETIRNYFNLPDNFKQVKLKGKNNEYSSETKIVKNFVSENKLNKKFLDKYPLYPDQLVYLNKTITLTPNMFEVNGDKVTYRTELKQATTLEETLAAYLFVISTIKKNKLKLNTMNKKEVNFINNWEAEKYRRTVK